MTRVEVIPVNVLDQMSWNIEIIFDESPVDDQLRLLIGNLAGTPGLDLLTERIEGSLNPIDADGQRIRNREVLGVLRKNRCERAWDNVAKLNGSLFPFANVTARYRSLRRSSQIPLCALHQPMLRATLWLILGRISRSACARWKIAAGRRHVSF